MNCWMTFASHFSRLACAPWRPARLQRPNWTSGLAAFAAGSALLLACDAWGADPSNLTNVNSITASANTGLTLAGGSGGANISLGPGANGRAIIDGSPMRLAQAVASAAPFVYDDFDEPDSALNNLPLPTGGTWAVTGVGQLTALVQRGMYIQTGGTSYAYMSYGAQIDRISGTYSFVPGTGANDPTDLTLALIMDHNDASNGLQTMIHLIIGPQQWVLEKRLSGGAFIAVLEGSTNCLTDGTIYGISMELEGSTVTVQSESGIASATDADFATINPRYGVWEITKAGNGSDNGYASRWNSITMGKTIGGALRAEIGALPVGSTFELPQSLTINSTPTFQGIDITGPATLNGAISGVSSLANTWTSITDSPVANSGVIGERARGSPGSPSNVESGDQTLTIAGKAYSGGKFFNGAEMDAIIDGAVTAGQAPPTAWVWYVNGAGGYQTLRMKLDHTGNLTLGHYGGANALATWDSSGQLYASGIGSSLKVNGAGGVVDTVQDIRPTASPTFSGLVGSTAGKNAASGNLGEFVSSAVAIGSSVGLKSGLTAKVASVTLSAGDWDVEGSINFITSNPTAHQLEGGVSAKTSTMPTDGSEVYSFVQASSSAAICGITVPRKRVNVSSVTTVYLVAKCDFPAGSASAFGQISARRAR